MHLKRWTVAGTLALTMAVAGLAAAQETPAAKSGESLDAAGLPASIVHALELARHHHHHHQGALGGIKR